jgi:hypothetical protein
MGRSVLHMTGTVSNVPHTHRTKMGEVRLCKSACAARPSLCMVHHTAFFQLMRERNEICGVVFLFQLLLL